MSCNYVLVIMSCKRMDCMMETKKTQKTLLYNLQPMFIAHCWERFEHAFLKMRLSAWKLSDELKSLIQAILLFINMQCSVRKSVAVIIRFFFFANHHSTKTHQFQCCGLKNVLFIDRWSQQLCIQRNSLMYLYSSL